jgi:hypothetical protein
MSSCCYLETDEYADAEELSKELAGNPSRNVSKSLLPPELSLFPRSFHDLNDAFAQQLFRSASKEQRMLDSIMGRTQKQPTVELPNLIVNDFMRHYCALAVAFHDLASHQMALERTSLMEPSANELVLEKPLAKAPTVQPKSKVAKSRTPTSASSKAANPKKDN